MNWKLKFWKNYFTDDGESIHDISAADTLKNCDYDAKAKILNSNLRHLEFIDFYEGHLRSREQTDFIQDQLESLEYLKNDIKSELVMFYSRKPNF